jgi:hypothetical protein
MTVKTETGKHVEIYAGYCALQAGTIYTGINVWLILLIVPFYAHPCAPPTLIIQPVCSPAHTT